MIDNPVLPGFNPDPSIVRVGDDYYIATSTMVWQPGIRLFHSTDLANWTLTGHALRRGEHELRGLDFNAGIWAPSLTYDRRPACSTWPTRWCAAPRPTTSTWTTSS